MSRKIQWIQYSLDTLTVSDPLDAINVQVKNGAFACLLSTSLDGINWGTVQEGKLNLSHDAFPQVSPELIPETLIEARLFSKDAECFFWKQDGSWKMRRLADTAALKPGNVLINGHFYDEEWILWGTNVGKQMQNDDFALAEEADTGICHAPPKLLTARHSLCLVVRHYIAIDDYGAAFIRYSRLVDLHNRGEK